jgi:hypothetical protein
MPRSGPAFDDLDSNTHALAPAGPKRSGLNDWPEPPWRYQVLAIALILLGLGAMTLAAP